MTAIDLTPEDREICQGTMPDTQTVEAKAARDPLVFPPLLARDDPFRAFTGQTFAQALKDHIDFVLSEVGRGEMDPEDPGELVIY